MVLMFVNVSYNVVSLIFRVFLSISSDGIWVEPLALTVMTMNVGTFQPLFQVL